MKQTLHTEYRMFCECLILFCFLLEIFAFFYTNLTKSFGLDHWKKKSTAPRYQHGSASGSLALTGMEQQVWTNDSVRVCEFCFFNLIFGRVECTKLFCEYFDYFFWGALLPTGFYFFFFFFDNFYLL